MKGPIHSVPIVTGCVLLACCCATLADDAAPPLDEFRVKREPVFEFVSKPTVARDGDRITVAFQTKGRCDVTVAIEKADGQIVRHLAAGVLGPNAPEPFQKDSTSQSIVWDGKDDQGVYINDKDSLTVRVSLGLKPQFERTLFWSPKKRIAPGRVPHFAVAPEGVYVHEAGGVDHIRLFDHKGNFVQTVYPFPADYTSADAKSGSATSMKSALAGIAGLEWTTSPMDGLQIPRWQGIFFHTLLTSGDNAGIGTARINPTKYGSAASAMAVRPGANAGKAGYLALLNRSLNRVATDGTTGGMPLHGPTTSYPGPRDRQGNPTTITPSSAAFSPDGKWLYMILGHCLARMDFAGDASPEPIVGDPLKPGKGDSQLGYPTSLAVDSNGRIYVADYFNSRIQVFTPDGKLYKSIPWRYPARVFVSPKNGHIYVATWMLLHAPMRDEHVKASLAHLGPVDDPKQIAEFTPPFTHHSDAVFMNRTWWTHEIFVDFHTDPATIWVVPGSGDSPEKLMQMRRDYSAGQWQYSRWAECYYRLYAESDGKLVEQSNWAQDVADAIVRVSPPSTPAHERQRLYVNPKTGMLYVLEGDTGVGKATNELLSIDPNTGKVATRRLPFATEEIAFDLNNCIYLRTDIAIGRFDIMSWREVPFDYGEELISPGFNGDGGRVNGFVRLPTSGKPGCFHLGGFALSPKGNMVVSCYNTNRPRLQVEAGPAVPQAVGKPYTPPIFPGRSRWAEVHVFDKYGKPVHVDAVPGLTMTDGLEIDRDDNIYALWSARRLLPGQNVSDNDPSGKGWLPISSETLAKFKPGKAKVLCSGKTDITLGDDRPKRPADVFAMGGGQAWAENAEWLYGGVGCNGFIPHWAPNCSCWNARPTLDLFARSFATELARSRVAVLDTNGNLIMRIGKYGNVEDGLPLVKAGGPDNPRSVGGDEVALAKPTYLATHTDHRLFIADYGNYRILSVKLGYHAEERVPLKAH